MKVAVASVILLGAGEECVSTGSGEEGAASMGMCRDSDSRIPWPSVAVGITS